MKIVVDTNIFFSGLNPKSYYHPIIKGIYLKKYSLLISTSVLLEYEEILQKVFSKTLLEEFWLFILASENIFFINPTFNFQLPFADADDQKFVDCAMPIF
jgi:putative PIN family toxin of toxin-antitoxin system